MNPFEILEFVFASKFVTQIFARQNASNQWALFLCNWQTDHSDGVQQKAEERLARAEKQMRAAAEALLEDGPVLPCKPSAAGVGSGFPGAGPGNENGQ